MSAPRGVVPEFGPDRVALVHALRQLQPRQRQAVVLHYLADLPVSQVAAEMGVPEGTVKSWLHRGRLELSALLEDPLEDQVDSRAEGGLR